MTGDLDLVRSVVAWLLIGAGGILLVVAAIGINRMPDVFTRLHAVSVGDTMGAGLMIVGMMVVAGISLVTVKLLFLLLLLWFFGPIIAHAVARAALQAGHRPILSDGAGRGEAGTAARGEEVPPSKS